MNSSKGGSSALIWPWQANHWWEGTYRWSWSDAPHSKPLVMTVNWLTLQDCEVIFHIVIIGACLL